MLLLCQDALAARPKGQALAKRVRVVTSDVVPRGVTGDVSIELTLDLGPGLVQAQKRRGVLAQHDDAAIDICGCAWFSLSVDGRETETDALKDVVAYFGFYLDPEALATVGLGPADFEGIRRLVETRRYDEGLEAFRKAQVKSQTTLSM